MMKRLAPALLCLAAAACVRATMSDAVFPPGYASAIDDMPVAPRCASFARAAVRDGRSNPSVIGHRYSEDEPQNRFPISMSKEPAAWAQEGLEAALRRASLPIGPGKAELAVTLATLELEERAVHNSNYEGKLVLDVTVTLSGTEAPCWSGRVDGYARNYGASGSPVNYRETLNHALDRATSDLLSDKGFLDAACGVCGGAAPGRAGPAIL